MVTDPQVVSFESSVETTATRAEELLAAVAHRGAKYGDVFLDHIDETTLRVDASPIRSAPVGARQERSSGLAIRAYDDQAQHVAGISGWRPARWDAAAREVAAKLKGGSGPLPPLAPLTSTDVLPADAPHVTSREEKEALLDLLLETAYSYDASLERCVITYRDITRQTALFNTAGQAITRAHTRIGLRMEVSFDAGATTNVYGVRGYTGSLGAVVFENAAVNNTRYSGTHFVKEVIDRARRTAQAGGMDTGVMPVVFAGGWAGIWLHEALGHVLEADIAPASLEMGAQIAPESLTVHDDPSLPGLQGSYAIDDEGIPSRRTPLIEQGRVANLLTGRFHADKLGLPCTGNGRRARYNNEVLPRMSNLCMAAGNAAPEEIVEGVQRGLYVKQAAAGVHHAAAGETGRFELNVVEGYEIEAGKITRPVTGVVVAGHWREALRQVRAVGNDVTPDHGSGMCEKAGQVIPVAVQAPTVLIDGLEVRG